MNAYKLVLFVFAVVWLGASRFSEPNSADRYFQLGVSVLYLGLYWHAMAVTERK